MFDLVVYGFSLELLGLCFVGMLVGVCWFVVVVGWLLVGFATVRLC